jgi:hypothetical protein
MSLGDQLRRLDERSLSFSESRLGRTTVHMATAALVVTALIIQWRKWGIEAGIALGVYLTVRFVALAALRRRRDAITPP